MSTAAPELEVLIAELSDDETERETIRRTLRLLPYAAEPTEPHRDLKSRILARIGEPQRGAAFIAGANSFARSEEMEWVAFAPGVEVKILHQEPSGARTVLIKMAPNQPFPPHPHGFIEDLYLVSGDAWVDDVPMRAGDYCRAPAGSEHNDVRSGAAGSLAVVISR